MVTVFLYFTPKAAGGPVPCPLTSSEVDLSAQCFFKHGDQHWAHMTTLSLVT